MTGKWTALCLGACLATGLKAQKLNHHDVLLLTMTKGADSLWRAGAPRFLTSFNRSGYNNQPAFFSDNTLYLTVQMPDDTNQTEVYALDLLMRTRTRVTATSATSEYSPTPMPGGKRFSAVRVEEDGSTQRLWSFPVDQSDSGRPEFPGIAGVGYHCWLRDTLAALFIVGQDNNPHVLQLVGTKSQRPRRIASNIGRCLQIAPGGRLAFVQKATEQTWYLKTYDPKLQTPEIVAKMPAGSEDYVFLANGAVLTGSGAKLFQYKPGRDAEWREAADLSAYGVKNISRLALSRDGKLAAVVQ